MKIHIKEIVLEIKMSHISCLVVGDCHFQVNNTSETDMMADKIIGIIKERNPTYVVVLGDVHYVILTETFLLKIFLQAKSTYSLIILLINNSCVLSDAYRHL